MKLAPGTERNLNLKMPEKTNSEIMTQFLKLYLMFPSFTELKACILHPVLSFDRIYDLLNFTITIPFFSTQEKENLKI